MNMSGVSGGGVGMSGMSGCSGSQHAAMTGGAKNASTVNQASTAVKAKGLSLEANLGRKVDIEI